MNPTPLCGHAQCAGADFCGFTGQRIAPVSAPPPPAVPAAKSRLGLVIGALVTFVLISAVALIAFRGYLGGYLDHLLESYHLGRISSAASTPGSSPSLEPRYSEIRIPGWFASLPTGVVYVSDDTFHQLALEPIAGRLLSASDNDVEPIPVVVREEIAEVVTRGLYNLKSSGPEYAERAVPTPQDFVGREVEIGGQSAVIVGIVGRHPVDPNSLRRGLSTETAIVYMPRSARTVPSSSQEPHR